MQLTEYDCNICYGTETRGVWIWKRTVVCRRCYLQLSQNASKNVSPSRVASSLSIFACFAIPVVAWLVLLIIGA